MLMQFLLFVLVGFFAQVVDGAVGMGYGVISSIVLISLGVSPAVASASIHTAEIIITGISGLSHAMFKNVDYALFRRLAIPGILGGVLGAYVLTKIPNEVAKPIVVSYLFIMGVFILYRTFREGKIFQVITNFFAKKLLSRKLPSNHARGLTPIGFAGGFFDAAGGGGWGAIVTSSLLAQGTTPHYTIGSVSLTEFLVTISVSATFFFTIGISHLLIIAALIIGGAIGAPFAAYTVRHIHPRALTLIAGCLVIMISIYTLIRLFI